ncbi:MAG: ABC transporter ATP-binding protein [Oscillospiraceae bacterium]
MKNKLLEIKDINTFYGSIHALKGVSMEVYEGEIVTLIGSNGAGKSTTLSSITGLTPPKSGSIIFDGKDITHEKSSNIIKMGIGISPEGREVFPTLTVLENLKAGAYTRASKTEINESIETVFELFPRLLERKRQYAGTLSGGEQQMLAIGRAMMSKPKLLLLDEPSLGLAPNLVEMIFKLIMKINKKGVTVMLIEQNANMALQISDRGYVLETGTVSLSGPAEELRVNDEVRKAYLGSV